MNLSRLDEILDQFPSKRVLVVGDLMLDEFIWGRVSRISPEAPVPVVEVLRESYYPGGAANVARNVRECGTQAYVMGLIGDDSAGTKLRKILEETGIRQETVQAAPTFQKSKTRASRQSNNCFLRLMPLFWKTTEKAFCNNRSLIRLPCSPPERQLPRTRIREISFSGEELRQLSQIGPRPFPLQTNRGRNQRNIRPKIRHFSR